MGITQVDPREVERFEEGLGSEYHDAAEEPHDTNRLEPERAPCFSHGGCGSSSLHECLELLNQASSNSPAPCHSRVTTGKIPDPPHPQMVFKNWAIETDNLDWLRPQILAAQKRNKICIMFFVVL